MFKLLRGKCIRALIYITNRIYIFRVFQTNPLEKRRDDDR